MENLLARHDSNPTESILPDRFALQDYDNLEDMAQDFDEIQEQEAYPEHACRLCGRSDVAGVVRCIGDNKWFCNYRMPGIPGSCIIVHLVASKYKEIQLHPEAPLGDLSLECFHCGARNIFVLGYLPAVKEAMVILLCRVCASTNAMKFSKDAEEKGWDLSNWQALIYQRQLVSWLVKKDDDKIVRRPRMLNKAQIMRIEECWRKVPDMTVGEFFRLETQKQAQMQAYNQDSKEWSVSLPSDVPEVQLCYDDAVQYSMVFTPLIQAEAAYDRFMKENQRQVDVTVKWEITENQGYRRIVAYFHFKRCDNEPRLAAGDELRIALREWDNHPKLEGEEYAWIATGHVIYTTTNTEAIGVELRNYDGHNEEKKSKRPTISGPWKITRGYVVEFVWKSTSFDRMHQALRIFQNNQEAISTPLYRRILGHEVPQFSGENQCTSQYMQAPNLPQLNHSQIYALRKALYQPLTIIQGPPGTGKTVTSASLVYNICKLNQKNNYYKGSGSNRRPTDQVLVCAPSNIVVDSLAQMLDKTGLKVCRLSARSRESVETPCDHLTLHNQLAVLEAMTDEDEYRRLVKKKNDGQDLSAEDEKKMRTARRATERTILQAADVICCTCVGAGDGRLSNLRFKHVLIDEATQATEPECLIPCVKGAQQIILLGDNRQLGPVVMCKKVELAGLSQSLFERLIYIGVRPLRLTVQYRMHPCLSEFPSITFYDGSLQNGVGFEERMYKGLDFPWPNPNIPMFFYHSSGQEEISSSGTSYLNRTEAIAVEKMVSLLLNSGLQTSQIGIITPYEGQRAFICQTLKSVQRGASAHTLEQVEVASVDSFQGREKDFVILSCVRSNTNDGIGFTADPKRLNVSISRARYGLVICGNAKCLDRGNHGKPSYWTNLLNHFQQRGVVVEGPLGNLKPCHLKFMEPVNLTSFDVNRRNVGVSFSGKVPHHQMYRAMLPAFSNYEPARNESGVMSSAHDVAHAAVVANSMEHLNYVTQAGFMETDQYRDWDNDYYDVVNNQVETFRSVETYMNAQTLSSNNCMNPPEEYFRLNSNYDTEHHSSRHHREKP